MLRLKNWIKSFFGFSRSETNAFLILLPLLLVLLLSGPIYRWWFTFNSAPPPFDSTRLDSLIATWNWDTLQRTERKPPTLLKFNPNSTTVEELIQLGLSEKLSRRIANFRQKGGSFKIKSDLGKIYGMDSSLMIQLAPFIDLPERKATGIQSVKSTIKPQTRQQFDLNLVDSIQLERIYGIGPKRSRTLLKYRDRLGGFVSLNQLNEIYGFDSIVVTELKKKTFIRQDFKPRQININTATEKILATLPYIKWNLAKSIAAYRFQHGAFTTVHALQQLVLVDDSLFQKIKPYLTVNDSL